MTIRLKFDDKDGMIEWSEKQLGRSGKHFSPLCKVVGVTTAETGAIRAVFVLDGIRHGDGHVHVVSDGTRSWATERVLKFLFRFAFLGENLRRLTAQVPADRLPAVAFAVRLGFQPEGIIRSRYADGVDVHSLGMLRGECRYLHD